MEKILWKRKVHLVYMLIDPTKDMENLTAQSIYSFEIINLSLFIYLIEN